MPKSTKPFQLNPQSALEMVDNACANYEGTRNDHNTLQACMNLLKSCVQTCADPEIQELLKARKEKAAQEAEAKAKEEAAASGTKSEAAVEDASDSDGDGDADQPPESEAEASPEEGKGPNGQAATAG
jgi:hypothetical protein